MTHVIPDVSPSVPSVLLVENAHDERRMYAEGLRLEGFRAIEIDDTADALALAPTAHLIVTEVRVAGPFDGIELVRRLRADDRTKAIPVIVLTASMLTRDRERASAAGCDAVLTKPCLPDTLVAEIRRVLASRRDSAPAQPAYGWPRHPQEPGVNGS